MRHQSHPPARLLIFVALFALALDASAPAQTAQKKGAAGKSEAQKKRPEKVKPGKTLLPEAQKLPDAGLKPVATQVSPSILVRWQGKSGVNRYRLQLATDEKFEDVVFDKAVEGRQYVVKDLPPGNYFWRVAPAAAETSIVYSAPERVSLGTDAKVEVASVVLPADAAGWRTATGEVALLAPAALRPGGVVDFVGVGADGRVFAVDGASGISLWTARYGAASAGAASQTASDKRVTFAPLVIGDAQRGAKVVVATQGGVRALQGDTGRELWRAALEGRASAGVATDFDGDGTPEAVVMTQDPSMFYVVNA
ncbi:MAG TPA: PQQ-binding-like beta-propeller repeat protein, partial [Pyrinomonadaceae bacterium]|nr:PQQ-binding-like beta-propeller repeat protein [Pyrinomonadaceae bacterium]